MIKKSRKIKCFAAVVFFAAAFSVFADISFDSLDLNSDNKAVFTVRHDISGSHSYSTAFMADVSTMSGIRILTCFPESMDVLSKGSVLQIRNRYGTAQYSLADNSLSWITRTSSIPSLSEKQIPQKVSPDGKWICCVKKGANAKGELILKNSSTLQETVLDKNCDFSYDDVPVLWNSESSCFLYEKNSQIYFCDPKAAFQKIQMGDEYRKIGDGKINCVTWESPKKIVYINRDLVYKISTNELYTRALYSDVVGVGNVAGRLPYSFDALRDSFSVNESGTSLILIQNEKIVTRFEFWSDGFEYLEPSFSKPVTDVPGTVVRIQPFWAEKSQCVLWVDFLSFENGQKKSAVYRLGDELKKIGTFSDCKEPKLSYDKKSLCFSQGENLLVYDLASWTLKNRLSGEKIVSYCWKDNFEIFVGGQSTVRRWKINSSDKNGRILFLSATKNVMWNSDSAVLAEDFSKSGVYYDFDRATSTWTRTEISPVSDRKNLQNGRYRIFAGTTPNQKFSNTLYVRTLSGKAVTKALFPPTAVSEPPLKKVFLAVDATDDAAGLSRVISVLKKYEIPATFFINGEFIRRYPKETRQIAQSGFDCASMFFSPADLTEKDFLVNEDFVRRGLARNEDEFFSATGKELSLLWHAPFYKSTEQIKKFGKNCGYRYVEAGRFSLDTITLEDAARGVSGYLSASDIIAFYAENAADGDVIPVSLGISNGSRFDYLYEKLDLLIGTLLNCGFEFCGAKSL